MWAGLGSNMSQVLAAARAVCVACVACMTTEFNQRICRDILWHTVSVSTFLVSFLYLTNTVCHRLLPAPSSKSVAPVRYKCTYDGILTRVKSVMFVFTGDSSCKTIPREESHRLCMETAMVIERLVQRYQCWAPSLDTVYTQDVTGNANDVMTDGNVKISVRAGGSRRRPVSGEAPGRGWRRRQARGPVPCTHTQATLFGDVFNNL